MECYASTFKAEVASSASYAQSFYNLTIYLVADDVA